MRAVAGVVVSVGEVLHDGVEEGRIGDDAGAAYFDGCPLQNVLVFCLPVGGLCPSYQGAGSLCHVGAENEWYSKNGNDHND